MPAQPVAICVDQPHAPASIASCSSSRISACSASVGMRPAFASSRPITQVSIGPMPMYGSTLTDFGARSTLSRNSGYVTQSHGMPSSMQLIGTASLRLTVNIARSRASGLTGAKEKPQLPITTDVTPCQPEIEQYGSQNSCES